EVHGDGTQTRCFCHVSDTIRALMGLMDESATTGEIYNVGSTESIAIGDLARRVLGLTDSGSQVTYLPYDQVYGQGLEDMLHRRAGRARRRLPRSSRGGGAPAGAGRRRLRRRARPVARERADLRALLRATRVEPRPRLAGGRAVRVRPPCGRDDRARPDRGAR